MKASRLGILFKCRREGFALGAYDDDSTGAGRVSIGFGHQSDQFKLGDTITEKQAFDLLRGDVENREKDLTRHLEARGLAPTQQQFDALLSRYYQGGTDNLVAILNGWVNHGTMAKGQRHRFNAIWLDNCVNANGEFLDGLQDRGLMELLVFWRGEYGDVFHIPFWRGNPTGKRPDGLYTVKDDDIWWRA